MPDERAQRAAEEIVSMWPREGGFRVSLVPLLIETIERHMNTEYLCTCGLRVEPHRCEKESQI